MAEEAKNVGYLKVAVKTAYGTLPVPDARVLVTGEDGTEILLTTDRSGLTERIALSAPLPENSMSARGEDPFTSYRVEVQKEGFYPQTTAWVPIFPGITSLQPILLIGLAEYESSTLTPSESTETVTENPQVLKR